jgi:hypothetical protein
MSDPPVLPAAPANVDANSPRCSRLDPIKDVARIMRRAIHPELHGLERDLPELPIRCQPGSRLLSLPTELRLMICRYLSLSPEHGSDFLGAYYSCRQLQKDMWDESGPYQDLDQDVNEQARPCSHEPNTDVSVKRCQPRFQLLRHLTVTAQVPHSGRSVNCCWRTLAALFPLYLDELRVKLIPRDDDLDDLIYGDMKSWRSRYFLDYVIQGRVNCKRVKFGLTAFREKEDENNKTTRLANSIPGTNIVYIMHVVENNLGQQTERTYSSDVRFRPTAPEGQGSQGP